MEKLFEGIDTVIIRVSDVEKSGKWYEEMLGFSRTWTDDELKLIVLNTHGPTSVTLWQTSEPISVDRKTASYPIFRVLNAEHVRATLEKRGVQVGDLTTDHVVTYFWFFDPDGNVMEACQVHA